MWYVWVAEDLESSGLESECLCGAGRGQVPRLLPSGAPASACPAGMERERPSPCPRGAEQPGPWETLLPCPTSALGLGNLVPAVTGRDHSQAERGVSGEAKNWERVVGLGDSSPVLPSCTREGQQIIKNTEEIL